MEIFVIPTVYMVGFLTKENSTIPDYDDTWIRVEKTNDGDVWAIRRQTSCLSSSGSWDYEPMPSSRSDKYLASHRFSFEDAMRIAKEEAPKVVCNGVKVTDFLKPEAVETT